MSQVDAIVAPARSLAEIETIVETLSTELDDVSAALTDTIHEHLDELDEDMRTWTLQSTRANLGVMVTLLREGTDPRSVVAPPEALGYAKEYVVRGLDFVLLQRAYRTAQGVYSGMILERLREITDDADHLADAMGFFNAWIFAWIETIERQLTDVYMAEREQWVRGAAAMRAAEVRAILAGAPVDTVAVGQRLGYELDRFHVGYVVWNETAGDSPGAAGALFGEMEQVAAAVAESLGARAPLTVAQGRHLACWTGRREPQHLADLRVPRGTSRGISVAAGTPAAGVEGFVLSHREALLARRVAQLRGDRAARATFPDLSLEALMIDDVEAARRFAARELGPLMEHNDATMRLASTLAVFLDEGASFVRAARRLGVHTNTVTYRVRRAEELLGHKVGERQLELRVALRLARLVR
ncbi:MAG TPA: helix-turn-helix domain-containing protein [Solirubrobacterales bacterium]|nr:helix-turn-helix domain-containing protein [Solirubrobacterales bacterium]